MIYPIDEQNFECLRRDGKVYVDKTALIHQMISTHKYYFLSRPRRFGKSLLISTLKAYFQGKRELFENLAINSLTKNWTVHPVFHFDMSTVVANDACRTRLSIENQLIEYELLYNIPQNPQITLGNRFGTIVKSAVKQSGQTAVVLIDEYDAPILNVIDHDEEKIDEFRSILNEFFSSLKDLSENLRFVLITGITKFSQMSIFSKLNNLNNISMDSEYDTICGISNEELTTTLKQGIQNLAKTIDESYEDTITLLRQHYDGYHFSSAMNDVYNPFSILNVLSKRRLDNYWFGSATPTFLLKLIKKNNGISINNIENARVTSASFDKAAENLTDFVPMLFQSGYLTTRDFNRQTQAYTLGFPNDEVRVGMSQTLLTALTSNAISKSADTFYIDFRDAIFTNDIDKCLVLIRTFLGKIPSRLSQHREDYFQTILYSVFKMCGANIRCEVEVSAGKLDILMQTSTTTYIMELKYDKSPNEALKQIDSKNYPFAYADSNQKIVKVGINFSLKLGTLMEWKIVE
mgnify:CR=1 FL=1